MDQTNEPRRGNNQKSDIWTKNHITLLPQQTYYNKQKKCNKTGQRYQHPIQMEPGQNKQRRPRIKKNKKLVVASIDTNGLQWKTKSLQTLLHAERNDIALISESKLTNKETANIKGYK